MEQILKGFSLSFLLRSAFSGAFFVLSFLFCVLGREKVGEKLLSTSGLDVLGFSVFAGVMVYSIHRSIIYPWLEWGMDANWFRRVRAGGVKPPPCSTPFIYKIWPIIKAAKWSLISANTLKRIIGQWDRAAKSGEEHINRSKLIQTWADFAHMQYTSALCIICGAVVGWVFAKGTLETSCPLVWFTVVLFFSGFFSDWRLHSVQDYLRKKDAVIKPD